MKQWKVFILLSWSLLKFLITREKTKKSLSVWKSVKLFPVIVTDYITDSFLWWSEEK